MTFRRQGFYPKPFGAQMAKKLGYGSKKRFNYGYNTMTELAPVTMPYGSAISSGMQVAKAVYNTVKRRGRPAGSKNKPKPAKPVGSGPKNPKQVLFKGDRRQRYSTRGIPLGFISVNKKNLKSELDKFAKKGSIHNVENGGLLTASSVGAIYPFHGIAEQQVVSSVFRAIVKELARQRKTDIVNWSEKVHWMTSSSDGYISITYVSNPGVPNAVVNAGTTLTINKDWTWFQLADELMKSFINGTPAGDHPREILLIQWYQEVGNRTGTAPTPLPMATIHAKQVLLDFKCSSTLTIQNRTLAENGNIDNDRDEQDDIENNPLIGKLYSNLGKWSNAIELQNRGQESGNLGTKSTVLNKDTGIALFETGSEYVDTLAIPPPAYVLGFKGSKKVNVIPGGILSNKLVFRTTLSMDKFMQVFATSLGTALPRTNSFKVAFGHIAGFGLEKMLDSARASGAPISVGYQIKQQYCCALGYSKRSKSNPSLEVSNTSISYTTNKPT